MLLDFTLFSIREDVKYLMARYFTDLKRLKLMPSRNSITSNNQRVLTLSGFQDYTKETKKLLESKLSQSVRQLNNPLQMLRELIAYYEHQQLVLPSYNTLQDLIGAVLTAEEKRLNNCVARHVKRKTNQLIDQLFKVREDDDFYDLTRLKQHPKNFNFKMIQQEIEKHSRYYPLYQFSKKSLSKLEISEQNITYYGSMVDYYQIQALTRFSNEKRVFYLLCYVYHRFQIMNNQLIETLVHYVSLYNQEGKEYSKLRAGDVNSQVKTEHGPSAKTLIYWYFDESLSKLVFGELQERALQLISKEKMILVGEFLDNDEVDKKRYEWEFHDQNYQAMIKNLRPLIKVLDFDTQPHDKKLLEGLKFIQNLFRNNQSLSDADMADFPIETIPAHLKKYLLEKDQKLKGKSKDSTTVLHPYRYEFYIYDHLSKQLSANKIYSNDTTQYKSFAEDIKLKKTEKEKKKLLNSLDSPRLNRSAELLLGELKKELEGLIILTNENITNDNNTHIKIKGKEKDRTWTLPYQKKSDEYNNPFYNELGITNFFDVMMVVNDECHYMDAFTHFKTHYSKNKNDIKGLCACIVANATGLGTYKMSGSSDISYNFLRAIEKNFIRLESLKNANDIVNQKFSKLAIYLYYKLGDLLHGGADGQKFKTSKETFNSRHSPKYYGLDKGVAPYSLGINYTVVNCIPDKGAHQHESHFLFDIIMNNTSGIDPDRVSTDTEGSNQIIFAFMYFADIDFTPCYRNLRKKVSKIGGFQKPDAYPEDYLIKPCHKFNEKLIIEEWKNIQDIMAAILSKETSISVITRKLCSHDLNDKTKRAIWELNDILRSIYLLRYVDDPQLRRYVRACLNRIEAYHALRRKIGETNGISFSEAAQTSKSPSGTSVRASWPTSPCITMLHCYPN